MYHHQFFWRGRGSPYRKLSWGHMPIQSRRKSRWTLWWSYACSDPTQRFCNPKGKHDGSYANPLQKQRLQHPSFLRDWSFCGKRKKIPIWKWFLNKVILANKPWQMIIWWIDNKYLLVVRLISPKVSCTIHKPSAVKVKAITELGSETPCSNEWFSPEVPCDQCGHKETHGQNQWNVVPAKQILRLS